MFTKILIANRGEIACRVIKTARQMGVQTVAVYSDADKDALHVRQADEAVRLGPAPVVDSYLRGELIIQAALEAGAQAIHPGYGFLSENPDFVDAVEAAGLVFIGPSAQAIRAMGLKDAAKALMVEAGVPVVPGYHGRTQDAAFLAKKAAEIGYPVLIKAVAGGGGKGMRLVEVAPNFLENLASAQAEAQSAFGNADVLIEKYVAAPRHIEMQIFGDGADAIHLFERDCSLQRRHQKVIEEAPAPGMTDEMRAAMGQAAVTAAKAIGYAGAGTVEFIVDGSGPLRPDGFWFMEMNTRLQVEHPVTEAVTGIDLVAWQLRVAAGEALPAAQEDLTLSGHAMEARLYAEDVPAGFLPATGVINHLAFPDDARIDSGVTAGSEISPWYDPMIAKLTVHAADRASCCRALSSALQQTHVAGAVTNLGFLRRLARHHDFVAGDVDTGLIARAGEDLTAALIPTLSEIAIAAVTAAALPRDVLTGFSLWDPLQTVIALAWADRTYHPRLVVHSPDQVDVILDEETVSLTRFGAHWGMPAIRHADCVTVFGAEPIAFTLIDPLDRATTAAAGDTVLAPMPGLVTEMVATPGQHVAAGDRLAVLEAMKMEHVLPAPRDGKVISVAVSAGDQVAAGALMVALEPLS
ncbi:biotin carboxylase N-terminal domain-containing protein [Yoonia sp. BS5-3]|uniref:Biotin carboxylase N-terminal domain-containing protein n=1 Tax=Yoonia phaeophyticola TaxID=3137369 RepID=A0ABZ2V378_9RHOB